MRLEEEYPGEFADIDKARAAALKFAREAAARGDTLAGALSELERMAEKLPGWEFCMDDTDDSDVDIYP